MTEKELLKRDLMRLLHYGREEAIKSSSLAYLCGYRGDREIRIAIRELIAEGWPIASTNKPPYGYYIICEKEEAEEYLKVLRSRLIQDALRRRDIKRSTKELRNPHQMALL